MSHMDTTRASGASLSLGVVTPFARIGRRGVPRGGDRILATLGALFGLTACSPPSDSDYLDAAECGDVEVVRAALRAGRKPDGTERNGKTALRLAAVHGRVEVVRVLLEAGADPQAEYTSSGSSTRITSRVRVGVQAALMLVDAPEYAENMKAKGVTKENLERVLALLPEK